MSVSFYGVGNRGDYILQPIDGWELNMSAGNAWTLILLLGFAAKIVDWEPRGKVLLEQARSAAIVAIAARRLGSPLPRVVGWSVNEAFHVDLARTGRTQSSKPNLSNQPPEDYFLKRLEEFNELVEKVALLGATHIVWS